MRIRTAAAAALATALLLPGAALAQTPAPSYPEPKDPGKVVSPPKGKGKTRTVCKRGCRFKTIRSAVKKSRKGDTVRVKSGTYRESVQITGAKRSYLKLIGNPRNPGKVVLEGGDSKQNGVFVNGADEVTVRGFKAQDYTANGFFFVNVVGYTARDLIAARTGVYGIYAFNSKGGTMRDSEAYYNNDAGFYIGQTPAQVRPIRSIVTNIDSWGNPLGWSGTNMRYVTITRSRFYNNAAGIVPNALDSEKFPPAEDNVIRGNEIFWNNFNFHKGAPFKIREDGTAALVPVGTGVLLLGGRRNIGRAEPDLRQLVDRRRRDRGHPPRGAREPGRARARGQRRPRQRVRPRRHRPQRARARLRRQRHRQLFRAEHRRLGDDPGRRRHAGGLPVHGRERVQRRRRRARWRR